jgi:hypothetical protein
VYIQSRPRYRFGLLANALGLSTYVAREWKPARVAAGIEPLRRIYDLRQTFATFALRAGIPTFDLSRYMGASLTMIDLLDELSAGERPRWTLVDATWTPEPPAAASNWQASSSQATRPSRVSSFRLVRHREGASCRCARRRSLAAWAAGQTGCRSHRLAGRKSSSRWL